MKRTPRMVVLTGLTILAVAMLHLGNPLQHRANLPTECWHASQLLADGGAPMPPWPSSGNALLADGGAPMPPWPSSRNVLLADGGAPMPPWPSSRNVLLADGGAPMPPWPPSAGFLPTDGGAARTAVGSGRSKTLALDLAT